MYTVPLLLALLSATLVLGLMYYIKTSGRFNTIPRKDAISQEMIDEINQIPSNVSDEVFIETLQDLSIGSNRLLRAERIKPVGNLSSFFSKADGVRLVFENGLKLACTMGKPESFLLEIASEVGPDVRVLSINDNQTADLQVSLGQPPLDIVVTVGVYKA
jgi:hypothetical protein